ncbi:MAG: hypothetical protein Q8M16_24805, partial [Pirellulaceae bacterium]|nr:hypothetical protein [Pirellulaceae bacterium]
MSRLFLRLYLGVVFVLFVAWLLHLGLSVPPTDESNASVIEAALSGSARLTRLSYEESEPTDRDQTLALIRRQFDFPVDRVPKEQIPIAAQN